MSELTKAIENITYQSKKFPKDAIEVILQNKVEALPYLREAIERAIEERDELKEGYQLHFYALFLLGEFHDRESFSKIVELVTLPGEVLDYLIGDTTTSGLKDILYNTYNGDMDLIKSTIMNEYVDEFVRAALLDVLGQLYLDGFLEELELKNFIKENIYNGKEHNYIFNEFATIICRCHFVDMLPEIKYMLDIGLMDEMCMGKYDSCVDEMFTYRDYDQSFCKTSISTVDNLKSWAMFERDIDSFGNEAGRKEFEKLIKSTMKISKEQDMKRKVGRNDACPCGSGKKYKFCCLNKTSTAIDLIESVQERNKWLKDYPYLGNERLENKVYLEDYFDAESIEIDKILYLGLMNRPGWIWLRDEKQEEKRCGEYLSLAFQMFMDKVKKEGIKSFKEYDLKFSIHYFCEEWIEKLLDFLKKSENKVLYNEVKKCRKEMQ